MTSFLSPLWRFLLTDLAGTGITIIDHLASDRMVTPKLNEPLEVSGSVPSDSTLVNTLHTDLFPYLAEGVRQLYCFRREANTVPYYKIRASTLVLQVSDAARSDDGRSHFTAWDPWQYLFARPVLQASGALVGQLGLTYPPGMAANAIAINILNNMLANADVTGPVASRSGFTNWLTGAGPIETCVAFPNGWKIEQGISVGQALQDLVSTGVMDIRFRPIYDLAQPGILCELQIYSQPPAGGTANIGAGSYRYGAIFAWDTPGRSTVGVNNLYDGTGRANTVQYFNGQGGPPVTRLKDAPSIVTYGDYWTQQFFPSHTLAPAVVAIAAEQLALRSRFKETLTVNPASERAPEPFVDYYLGDGVRVSVSKNLRQPLTGWQRVYGIPVSIDDNGVETVRELIVGPIGPPPPVAPASGVPTFFSTAISASLTTARRTGSVSVSRNGVVA